MAVFGYTPEATYDYPYFKIPAISTSFDLRVLIASINATSLEPYSVNAACLTVGEVDNGPGVNNFFSEKNIHVSYFCAFSL